MNNFCKDLVISLIEDFTFNRFLNDFHFIIIIFLIFSPLCCFTCKKMVSNIA